MNYNVIELRKKIDEKIMGLGVDPKFRNNPAYYSVLSEIDGLISQMNMFESAEDVEVFEQDGQIVFNWKSPEENLYSVVISSPSANAFRCIRSTIKKPFIGLNGKIVNQREVVEKGAILDNNNFITLTTASSMIDDYECEAGICNNSTWSEKKLYTSQGVMRDRENVSYPNGPLSQSIQRPNIDAMLYIPRGGFGADYYESKTILTRDKLDTAHMYYEEKGSGIRYSATVPLSQNNGLQDMILRGGYNPFDREIIIPPLSPDEIESMLQSEKNKLVAEGLKEYAKDREIYSYNSQDDPSFIYQGGRK